MAIDKRFLYYTTEAGFLNDKNKGNIDNKSVAFISANGKRAIYTHGKFFSAEAFVVGTQIASTNAFTGTFNEADGLYDGLNIRYWLPYNGTSSAATLNLTINGTQTGAIPVYIKGTTRFTNHIGGTNVLDLTYRENVGGIEKGWWVLGSYGDSADGNTTYTFTSGESGSFKVKPSNGTEQEISVGKPETAGTADKVEKNLVIQINSGSEEYVSKYTYNGSSAKTLNIIQGSNINFGVEDGELIINGAYQNASTISNGLMSSDDKKKLNGISEGAEVNQNAFSKIKIGDTLIEADTKTDELTLEAGSNITLTPDTAGDKIIISAKDTTYTNATTSKDGLMSSEDKTKLDGIDEEANNYIHPSHTEYASGLYKIKIDEEGHVEAAVGVTKSDITALGIPAQDTDTHYESKNVVGSSTSSTTNTTSVLSNGNVYLNSIENGSVTSSHKISGSGNTTVKTDASGNIIVNSPTTIAWGSVTGKPSTFTPSDHDHTVSDITDFPETQELSVNGTAYDVYTSETSLPSFYAPSTLGSNGQVLKSDGSKLVWSSDKNDNTWRGIALTDGTTDTTVLGTGTNTGSLKFKAGNNVNLSADSGVITINSSYVDTDTTYSFASGTNGSFSVTPKNGSKQTVSIGKPSEAGIADEVSNPFTITVNSGTEEGTDKYTFTGADSKTLNITAGSNVTLTPSAGGLQISSSFTNTDTKAKVTTGTTTKSYLVGVNSSGYTSGNATDKFITDTGVYLDTTSGKLTATTLNATTLSGNLKGTIDSTTTATTPSAGDKSTKVATTAFVDTAISTALGSLADAMIFKGIVNSNTDLPASHEVGWTYRVGTKGTYAGATCEVGDLIICITAGTSASNAHWTIAQNNIDGAVTGPTSATDGNFALFSGSTGKIIKNSSYSPSSFTYTAGAGLSLSNNKFSIDSDLIEGTYGPEANVTGTDGITVVIPQIKVDENGLISEISEFTYTSKDTNTHYTTGLYVGASGAKSNAATSNGSTYIKLYDNDTSRASFKITGSGATTVKSDSSGNITITSSNDNTTYTLSGALDGDTFKSTLTPSSGSATTSIVPVFSGATSSAAGKAGLVPSPESSESSLYLKADGTWSKPTDTTYSAATTTAAGLMSAADKTKLDGIATGANKYVHPTYTSKSSGLYKITVNGTGHVSATASVSKADITALGIPGQDTTYDVMTGATSSVAGESGLVPAPEAGSEGLFLKGDGTWAKPTDTVYSHPTYTARTGKPTANATPGFGGTFTVSQITSNTLGHVTGATDRTITIPNTTATTSTAGLMSAADKEKLDGIATEANKYVHPSYTSKSSGLYKITVDGTGHVSATTAVAKADITALGIPSQDTTYSVFTGATSSADGTSGLVPQPAKGNQSKYLRGDGSWVTPTNTTYTFASGTNGFTVTPSGGSAQTVTVTPSITNNVTYSGTLTDSQVAIFDSTAGKIKASGYTIAKSVPSNAVFTDTKYSAGTGISLSGTTFSNSGVRSVATGATNGTIKVNTGGTEAEVSVAGLGTAAYKSSTTSVTSGSGSLVTSGAVYTALNNLLAINDAMVFKGTLGTSTDGGTVTSLPSTHNAGWTYKVVTAGTYAGKVCEIGDLIICIKDATAAADGDWTVVQTNIDGAVTGPTSSVENRVAIFDGTSGKVIKDSGYTIAKSVPSDAKFTDTVYSLPLSASGTRGGIKIGYTNTGANVAVQLSSEKAYVALTKTAVTTALGYTPPTTNTTYSVFTGATADANGSTGLVPQPTAGNQGKYLRADGSWATPTNTTYSAMTASEATTGTATTARSITAKVLHDKITEMLPTVTQTATSGNEIGSVGGTKLYSPIQTTVSGNAGSATKLQTARTIDGVDFDGSSAITHYGTCSTAASTVAKTVSLTGFKLVTGSRIAIKFTVTNTAANPTLNVNSTGAKAIMYRGSAISAGYLAANRVYEFVYDGTDYELIGDINTNTTYNVATTSANGLMSSAMVTKLNGIADNADNVTFTQTLTSGTKIGSISINGTSTDIYCQTNTNTTYTAGTGLSLSSTKFSTSTGLYNESSATTAATAGWYRIATSSASIANCSATFRICGAVSGKHTVATIVAGTSYGIANSSSITVLHCSQYSTNALTKVRIVYHTSYSNNYAYLEVYNPNATALPISVKIIGGYGWSLVTPSTAGSIPSGYSSKEASLTDGTVYSEKFTGNGSGLTSLNASNISSGTIGSARLPDATTSAKGAMTTAMVTKLNGIATGATKVVESTVSGWGFTKNTGTVTSVTLTQGTGITVSSSGTAITTTGSRTITLNTAATDTIGGIKIGKDNSSYAVTAGTSSISADVTSGKYYAVEIDKNDKAFVYVPWTDTKNTSGSTNSSSKLFLIGATEQSANPTTYSHDTAYVGTDGHLYSDSKQVVNLSGTQALTNKTYNGYTLAAACAKGVATSVASGNTSLVTSGAVYTAIANSFAANDAMIFKGTLGTSGTVTALPAEHNVGWTYRVITAGTYAGKACEIGDLIICITDGTSANDAHWTVAQTNIDGAVVGPTSSTDGRVALFSGTSGKVLKQSSYTLGCSVPADAKFTDTVYTHPSNTQVSSGLYKITTNSTGHITAATAVVKADITALGIPGSNTTYGIGDYDTSGLIKPWKSYTKASTGPTAATSDTAVAVNGITTTSGRYYAVEMDSSGRAFVNVPWVDTNTNTDTKVNVTLATTSKAYLIGVTTAPTATAAAMTAVSDTGVYLDTTAGVLTATTFKGALSGNASSATYASNVRITATTSAGTYYPSWTSGTTSGTDYVLRGNSNFTYKIVAGTTSAQGYDTIYLGNSTASGTANNSAGRLLLYSSSTSYHTLVGDATTSTVAHTLPTTGGTILNTGTTSITAVQTSGAHIATLKINGADTKLYAPNNPSLGLGTEATNSTASTLIKSISVSGHTITVTKYNGTIGSTTKPAYFNAGVPTVCSTYAGGTKVTLNGTEKGASTASFYAPTAAGTEGYILVANSSGIPVWKDYGAINYKSGTVTKAITTSWAEFISNTNMATYCPASGTYVVQVYSSTIRYNSGIFSWNSAGTSDDEILLHRCGAGTNIYLKIVNGALHIAGASAVASGSINVKIKRLI